MSFYLRHLELIVEFKHPLMPCRDINRSSRERMASLSTFGENVIWCQSKGKRLLGSRTS